MADEVGLRRAVLAYALAGALLAAGWIGVGRPAVRAFGEQEVLILRHLARVSELERSIEGHSAARSALTSPVATVDSAWIPEGDPVLAAVALQQLVRATVVDTGARLSSIGPVSPPAPDPGNAAQVAVAIEFGARIEELADALIRLEATHPYLFVDVLSVRPALGASAASALQVMAEVRAYRRPPLSVAQGAPLESLALAPEALRAVPAPPLPGSATVTTVVTAPLFRPDRRPRTSEPIAPPPVAPEPAQPAMRLTAVSISAGGRFAMVERTGGGVSRVEVGDEVDGWRVVEIRSQSMLLRRDDRSATLSLSNSSG